MCVCVCVCMCVSVCVCTCLHAGITCGGKWCVCVDKVSDGVGVCGQGISKVGGKKTSKAKQYKIDIF